MNIPPKYNKTKIRIERIDDMVVLQFDSPLTWFGMDTECAIEFAEYVMELAVLPVKVLEEERTVFNKKVQCLPDED